MIPFANGPPIGRINPGSRWAPNNGVLPALHRLRLLYKETPPDGIKKPTAIASVISLVIPFLNWQSAP
jgi:hypothetical protein